MEHLASLLEQILVFVVEKGEVVFPVVAILALAACVWSWRRRRALVRYGLGGLLALVTLVSGAAFLFAHTVRADLRERTLDLHFRTLDDGQAHSISDWRGQVVVVNYWATWCEPCRRELPDLAHLAQAQRDRGVVVITLTDEAPEVVRKWGDPSLAETIRGTFTDAAPAAGLAGVVLGWRPVTLVLDRSSDIRRVLLGLQTYGALARAVRGAR